MLHTLDARLAQARAEELGHIEFLQVLGCCRAFTMSTTAALTVSMC